MAEVTVSTWAGENGLAAAITGASEDTTILLTADIDLREEGIDDITAQIKGTNFNITIDGNDNGTKHKIRNITSSSVIVLSGYSASKRLTINNANFENVYLTKSGNYVTTFSVALARYTNFNNCIFSAEVATNAVFLYYCPLNCCGVYVKGVDNARLQETDPSAWSFCNIELEGTFRQASINMYNSYLTGNFKQTQGTGNNYGLRFPNSYISQINATIQSDKDPSASSAQLLVCNSETWTKSGGGTVTFPDTMIPLTTTQMKDDTALDDVSFPVP